MAMWLLEWGKEGGGGRRQVATLLLFIQAHSKGGLWVFD